MIFVLTDTLALQFQTIPGVKVGFEIMVRKDFETANLDIKWSFVVDLFAIRLALTKYLEE